jgi:hypothetical protein
MPTCAAPDESQRRAVGRRVNHYLQHACIVIRGAVFAVDAIASGIPGVCAPLRVYTERSATGVRLGSPGGAAALPAASCWSSQPTSFATSSRHWLRLRAALPTGRLWSGATVRTQQGRRVHVYPSRCSALCTVWRRHASMSERSRKAVEADRRLRDIQPARAMVGESRYSSTLSGSGLALRAGNATVCPREQRR